MVEVGMAAGAEVLAWSVTGASVGVNPDTPAGSRLVTG
jgi:hypothetical protein